MNWNILETKEEVDQIAISSTQNCALIYKHSVRCSLSSLVLDRLTRSWKSEEMTGVDIYFLDIINHRNVSNYIAEKFDIIHQSPQVLIIRNGDCVYDNSHYGVNYDELKEFGGCSEDLIVSN